MSLPINILLFIFNVFVPDPIPIIDELFMLFVVLKKVKQAIDLTKKGIAVKKTFNFLSDLKKDMDNPKYDKIGCASAIFVAIICFLLFRAGLL